MKVPKSFISVLAICASFIFSPYVQVVSLEDGLNCEVHEFIDSTLECEWPRLSFSSVLSELSNLDPLPNRKRPAAVSRNQHQEASEVNFFHVQ
jgi:hypothetical protein